MSQQQDILNDLLVEAVRKRDVTQAKLYVQKGADPNCRASNIPVQEKLHAHSTNSFSVSGPVLHLAACVGQFNGMQTGFSREMTDFLIGAGARVDDRNTNGDTILMMAVKAHARDMVRYWLAKGASPQATDSRGNMVIKLASNIDSSSSVRQDIINDLMSKLPDTAPQAKTPEKGQFNASAGASAKGAEAKDAKGIEVMKPPAIVRRGNKPQGGGFKL